jgi:hypothetical protein
MESGKRYASSYSTAPANPPVKGNAPRSFYINCPAITLAELDVLEAFFHSVRGRYKVFSYTDEFGVFYPAVRLDTDVMDIDFLGPNQISVKLPCVAIMGGLGTPIAATLGVRTAYSQPGAYSSYANITSDWAGGSHVLQGLVNTPYGATTLNYAFPGTPPDLGTLKINFALVGSLLGFDVENDFDIYDVTLTVDFATVSGLVFRPTQFVFVGNAPENGTITNPTYAFDSDPTSFAHYVRTHFSGLSDPAVFSVYAFVMPD